MISHFQQILAWKEEENWLRLSDAADFGVSHYLHAKRNLARPFKSILDLQGVFQGIPAILVGAGPSLEKNGHLLASLETKALVFAGGSALSQTFCTPHFAVCMDPKNPLTNLQSLKIPLCFQARMHPENFSFFQGEALLAPDSHFSFLNYLSGDVETFNSGWTVGNFMAALAVYFGCGPIVSVGMDFCYSEEKKYAFGDRCSKEGLVEATDREGNSVATQKDWLMAVQWMENLSHQYPEIEFWNASEAGLDFWKRKSLYELKWTEIPDLQTKIDQAVANIPFRNSVKFEEWEQSLLRSLILIQAQDLSLEREAVYRELLFPLWKIWEPIFEQDSTSLPQKMELHKRIFFERIIQEHLHAIG